jgi:elongation factor G
VASRIGASVGPLTVADTLENTVDETAGHALLSLAISPKTDADRERLARGVRTLRAEDPTMSAKTDSTTGEVVIAGMGELHLEIIVDRLNREFNVEASVGRPLVAYKETVTRAADGEGRLARRPGGRGQYAHVKVHLYPGEPGSGYLFVNDIIGGAIPAEFIKPIDEGIKEALARGVLAGYPVDDVRLVLYDGSYHHSDSSELTFKIAGSMACNDAATKAAPILVEPVMRVEVMAPTECIGDVIGNLLSRRGRIQSQDDCGGMRRIVARIPLSQMFGYAADLRSCTRQRGTFAMEFAGYQPCDPGENQDTGEGSMVMAPRKPWPTLLDSSVALPEPIDFDAGND